MNDVSAAARGPISALPGKASDGKVSRVSRCLGVLLAMLFLAAGLGWLYFSFPVFKIIAARGWTATPCVIASSDVQREWGGHGDIYSVMVTYAYRVDGVEYTGDRYQFIPGSSSGYAAKAAVAARHPAGTHAVCYVNPANPRDVVIERGFTNESWWALGSVPFIMIGGFPLFYFVYVWFAGIAGAGKSADFSFDPAAGRELRQVVSRKVMVFGVAFFALFWNGLILIPIMTEVVPSIGTDRPEWGVGAFLLIFVGIGLKLLFVTGGRFLALYNPAVHVAITPGEARLGEPLEVHWRLLGRTDALSRLRISLVGSRMVSRGRRRRREIFSTTSIVDTTDKAVFPYGRALVTLPENAHAPDARSRGITWQICVEGTVRRWADIADEFPLPVLPPREEPAA